MITASHHTIISIVFVGLASSLGLFSQCAMAQQGVTLEEILRRAQRESQRDAVKSLIDTLKGETITREGKPARARLPNAAPGETAEKSATERPEPVPALTRHDPSQAGEETSKSAPLKDVAPTPTRTNSHSVQSAPDAAPTTSQPLEAATIEPKVPEAGPISGDNSGINGAYARPHREGNAEPLRDRFASPPGSAERQGPQTDVERLTVAPGTDVEADLDDTGAPSARSAGAAPTPTMEAFEPAATQPERSTASSQPERQEHPGTALVSPTDVGPVEPAPNEPTKLSNEDAGTRVGGIPAEPSRTAETPISGAAPEAPLDRGGRRGEPNIKFAPLPDAMRNLTPDEALALAAEQQIPSVNIEVYFQTGSTDLSQGTLLLLGAVGRALSDPQLKSTTFMIAGHSDAKGRRDINRLLSEQRAQAVREFLIKNFDIDADRLVAKGFGEDHPKDPSKPYADINRRVQIINLTTAITSNP